MTHQKDDTLLQAVCELLDEYGFDGLAEALTVVLNEAMKMERAHHLLDRPRADQHDPLFELQDRGCAVELGAASHRGRLERGLDVVMC